MGGAGEQRGSGPCGQPCRPPCLGTAAVVRTVHACLAAPANAVCGPERIANGNSVLSWLRGCSRASVPGGPLGYAAYVTFLVAMLTVLSSRACLFGTGITE